ncbi:Sec63 complex subunit SEC72 PWA37_002152 [Arxiozyma heterogenica]|uniref:Uncharacterized protein n=1 Tax=Arxiozyma heterogenica TaxID=278026 RepID=A0AAN7WP69_9SACH|nr:hypothetical protein RI543_001615 [Kazachstania heterogenica]
MSILYNENSKLISLSDSEETNEPFSINVDQINSLTKSLIGESNNNFTPKPNDNTTKLIKNLFDSGLAKMKQQKLKEALKNVSLAIEMSRRSRNSYEAFALQLQELQFMLKHKIDLELILNKPIDALQDLELLLGIGLTTSDVFIRLTDSLLKLGQYKEAVVVCERGLSFSPNETKLKALNLQCNRLLAEYNGDI